MILTCRNRLCYAYYEVNLRQDFVHILLIEVNLRQDFVHILLIECIGERSLRRYAGESPLSLENLPVSRAKMVVQCTSAGQLA